MEKHRNTNDTNKFCRFLTVIFCIFFTAPLFAIVNTDPSLTFFYTQKPPFYKGETIQFFLDIEQVESAEIITGHINNFPKQIKIKTIRKQTRIQDGTYKKLTRIFVEAELLQTGSYTLGTMELFIQGKAQNAYFPSITVSSHNKPDFLLTPSDPFFVLGTASRFFLYGKNYKTVEQIRFILSDHMLLEKEREFLNAKPNVEKPTLLAVFICTPLIEKKIDIPTIFVDFTSPEGEKLTLQAYSELKEILVKTNKTTQLQKDKTAETKKNTILTSPMQEKQTTEYINPLFTSLAPKLATLYRKERYSPWYYFFHFERNSLEKQHELHNGLSSSLTYTILFLILFIACTCFSLVFLKKHKPKILYIFLSIINFGIFVFFALGLRHPLAIGGNTFLKSIPENNAMQNFEIAEGTTLKILKSIDSWYLVKTKNNISGWILKTHCIVISEDT